MIKFSIITVCFNSAESIRECLLSVGQQEAVEVEHLIQDGGSTDGTLEIIRETAPQAYLVCESDGGIYDALNKAVSRATGDVIGILHSDDIFASPNVLENVSKAFLDSSLDGVYGDLKYISRKPGHIVKRYWIAGEFNVDKIKDGWMPPHPSLFLKRDIMKRYGAYDASFMISGDYDAILRWIMVGKIKLGYIRDTLVLMRAGGASNGSIGVEFRKIREDLRALRKNNIGGIWVLMKKKMSKVKQYFERNKK